MNEDRQVSDLSRRRFLTLLTHGGWVAAMGVLLYQVGRFLGAEELPSSPSLIVTVGKLADFPPGSTIFVSEARAWIHHDQVEGLTALDAVCTHMGCLVQRPETAVPQFQCPCHGSQFEADGTLVHGPAERPLRPLTVRVGADGTVTILGRT